MTHTKELFEFDLRFNKIVAGCDEVGRGPLAGPVVCAACVMPLDNMIDGIDDSKNLSEKKREGLYEIIIRSALSYNISVIDNKIIDEINILNATKRGMTEVVSALKSPDLVLVDAIKELPVPFDIMGIIKGDSKSYNIAAASILAKVYRDRIMREIDLVYPEYGFKTHKGYGTPGHLSVLFSLGATPIHRKTFIKNFEHSLQNIKEKYQTEF